MEKMRDTGNQEIIENIKYIYIQIGTDMQSYTNDLPNVEQWVNKIIKYSFI